MEVIIAYLLVGMITTLCLPYNADVPLRDHLKIIFLWVFILLWISVKQLTGYKDMTVTLLSIGVVLIATVLSFMLV